MPIKTEIEKNPNCWDFDRGRQSLYEQRHTKTIPLRAGKHRRAQRLWDSHEVFNTVLTPWFPQTMRFVEWFTNSHGGECGRIAIVKLPCGETVAKHIDFGDYYRKRDRFHLVIQGMYDYNVDGVSDVFSEGDFFWFDSQKTHHTKNIGTEDRIVVIFDILGSNFREKYPENG